MRRLPAVTALRIFCLALLLCLSVGAAHVRTHAHRRQDEQVPLVVFACVAGELRQGDFFKLVETWSAHVWSPLAHAQHAELHVALVINGNENDGSGGAPLHAVNASLQFAASVYVHKKKANRISDRHVECAKIMEHVRKASSAAAPVSEGGGGGKFWVISARPDMVWFEDIPDLRALAPGAHMRARTRSSVPVVQSQVSWEWWGVGSGTSPHRSISCESLMASHRCLTFDDQFAIMDAHAALAYWSPQALAPALAPSPCRDCGEGWPEGILTRRLIQYGVPLHLLSWSSRLAKYRLDHDAQYNCFREPCCSYACGMPHDAFWEG